MTRGAFLIPLLICAQTKGPETYRVAGTAFDQATGTPLPGVRIILRPTQNPDGARTMATGSDGAFAFDGLPGGNYYLSAARRGHAIQPFGQKRSTHPASSLVIVGPGKDTSLLRFPLLSLAAVSGRVTEPNGDPIENASITLFGSTVRNGRRSVTQRGYAYTNDLGEYRISGIDAGTYWVMASGKPWYAGKASRVATAAAYPATYSGNITDARAALPIAVRAGQTARVDLLMSPVHGVNITVNVSRKPDAQVYIQLLSRGLDGTEALQRFETSWFASHDIVGATPGRYVVRVIVPGKALNAEKEIEVGLSDITVDLDLSKSVSVRGIAKSESGQGSDLTGARLWLWQEKSAGGVLGTIDATGAFKVDGFVGAGRYFARLDHNGYYLASLAATGAKTNGVFLDVAGPGEIKLEVTARKANGRVRGYVRNKQAPVASAIVVLAPRSSSPDPAASQVFYTETDGSFDMKAVRPGDFVLFSFEDGSDLAWADPAEIAKYVKLATPIHVDPDGDHRHDLEPLDP